MNRVALVTGSSRGIGRAIVLQLAELGWHAVVNYRSDAEAAAEAMTAIAKAGARALAVQANITIGAEREKLLHETLRSFGPVQLDDVPPPLAERGWTLRTLLSVLDWHEAHHQGQAHLTLNLWKARQPA